MEGILRVTPEKLIAASDSFGSTNQTIRTVTDEMVSLVNSLKSTWQGEAAEAFNTKFMMLQDDMDKIHRMIDEHVKDLQDMATKYKDAETANQQTSEGLAGDVIN